MIQESRIRIPAAIFIQGMCNDRTHCVIGLFEFMLKVPDRTG